MHAHRELMVCRVPGCTRPRRDTLVPVGPLSGMSFVAAELMRHYGVEPSEHLDVWHEVEQAISEDMLDTGRAILTEHKLVSP